MLNAKEVYKSFGTLKVLRGIDLEIVEKEVISIVGASGAGKSTLLHILASLDKPDKGSVKLKGQNLFSLSCLLYTSPSPRDLSTSRMPSSA